MMGSKNGGLWPPKPALAGPEPLACGLHENQVCYRR